MMLIAIRVQAQSDAKTVPQAMFACRVSKDITLVATSATFVVRFHIVLRAHKLMEQQLNAQHVTKTGNSLMALVFVHKAIGKTALQIVLFVMLAEIAVQQDVETMVIIGTQVTIIPTAFIHKVIVIIVITVGQIIKTGLHH